LRTVIIEDEEQAVVALTQELKVNCPQVVVCGTASNIDDAYKLVTKVKPELIFLDIQLKNGNGFDLLTKLGAYNFKVIFITAYSQYALKAIKISALDYLLKPIDSEELINAVEKASHNSSEDSQKQLQNFIQNQKLNPLRRKLALPGSKGIFLYEIDTIIRIQAEGNYTTLFLKDGKKTTVAKTLREFEDILEGHAFLRIHHSHIINLNHLESYINKDGGYVIMDNNTTLPVSKRKKSDLLTILNNFHT